MLVESPSSTDPVGDLAAPHVQMLKKDALVSVLLDSASLIAGKEHGNEGAFAAQVGVMRSSQMKPLEQLTLEPYFRNVAILVGKKI
jgi:fibrillarin-like rRNA methylase